MYNTISHVSAYELLAALGALCELVGFVWIVAGVSQTLATDYGEADLPHRIWGALTAAFRYVFEEPPKVVQASGAIRSTIGLSGRLEARKVPENDIERLEQQIDTLRKEAENLRQSVDERFSQVQNRHDDLASRFDERTGVIEDHLLAIHTSSLRKEKTGALIFMLGALLTLIAALI
jgi:hypothetical protein